MHRTLFLALVLSTPLAEAQTPEFVRVNLDLPLQGTSALWTDFDGDGATDLVFGNGQDAASLFLQEQPGLYSRETLNLTSQPFTDGVFADVDGDGDRDFLLGSLNFSQYLRRDAEGFVLATLPGFTGLDDVRTVDVVDVDGDGRLDVFAGTRDGAPTVLLLNKLSGWVSAEGDITQDQSTTAAACWGDVDDDGDLDLYMTTSSGEPNRAFRNDGGDLMTWDLGIDENPLDATTSCTWSDADGDGDLDLFTTVANEGRSHLYLNEDATLAAAPESVFPELRADLFNASWGDLDNDGDLDLVVVGRSEPQRVFFSLPGRFREVRTTLSPGTFNAAVALHDFDADGDLDAAVATGDSNLREPNTILENRLDSGAGWLGVRLVGTASNREGIGAAVTVFASSQDRTLQLRQTMLAHTSRRTQSDTRLHFGLADADVDSVVVRWPTGARETYLGVSGGATVTLTETDGGASEVAAGDSGQARVDGVSLDARPNPTRGPVAVEVLAGESGPVTVEVFDMRGRRVWHGVRLVAGGEAERFQIDLVGQAPGVYAVRARAGSTVVSTRITLMRR